MLSRLRQDRRREQREGGGEGDTENKPTEANKAAGDGANSSSGEKVSASEGVVEGVTTPGTAAAGDGVPRAVSLNSSENGQDRALRTDLRSVQRPGTITVAYATTTNTCQSLAESLHRSLVDEFGGSGSKSSKGKAAVQICCVEEMDWWDEVLNPELGDDDARGGDTSVAKKNPNNNLPAPIVLLILPTWTSGTLPPSAQTALLTSLHEIANDWRVQQNPLAANALSVATFGLGSSAYDSETFCKPARDVLELMTTKLGARRLVKRAGTGDVESGDFREEFRTWMDVVLDKVGERYSPPSSSSGEGGRKNKVAGGDGGEYLYGTCSGGEAETSGEGCCGGGTCSSGDAGAGNSGTCGNGSCSEKAPAAPAAEEEEEEEEEEEKYPEDYDEDYDEYTDEDDYDEENEESPIMDLEDIGDAMKSSSKKNKRGGPPKEMVTPKQAIALKKEGYKVSFSLTFFKDLRVCCWSRIVTHLVPSYGS